MMTEHIICEDIFHFKADYATFTFIDLSKTTQASSTILDIDKASQ